jgi:hypothetical protein
VQATLDEQVLHHDQATGLTKQGLPPPAFTFEPKRITNSIGRQVITTTL